MDKAYGGYNPPEMDIRAAWATPALSPKRAGELVESETRGANRRHVESRQRRAKPPMPESEERRETRPERDEN